MKIVAGILGVLLIIVLGLGAYVYTQVSKLETERVTDDLHVIYGLGGNVGVLRTGEGAVVVDTMTFKLQGSGIMALAEELTGEPVVMVINTHYHSDHTHGNPAFKPGTRVVATRRTLAHLQATDAAYFEGAEDLMPNETFEQLRPINIGNKHLTLFHPGRGHTDGDLVVLFEEEHTIHMGDLFFNHHYPNIDLEAGGSIEQWSGSIDTVFAELDFDTVIPGHGRLADAAALRQFQQFIGQLWAVGEQAAENGDSLETTIASDQLTADQGYEEIKLIVPIGLTREFVLKRAWEEANGAFELRE